MGSAHNWPALQWLVETDRLPSQPSLGAHQASECFSRSWSRSMLQSYFGEVSLVLVIPLFDISV